MAHSPQPLDVLLSVIPSLPRAALDRLVAQAIDRMDELDPDPDMEDSETGSHACWILTCNDALLLPPMLRSRLDIVAVDGPGVEHFEIAVAAILHDIALGWGVPRASIPEPPPRAMRTLRDAFARTRSLRRLRRHLEAIVAALVPHDRGSTH